MPAIDQLMKRLGFVKLEDYGLALTSDDRVVSTRPAVLDDGFGGRIVGWRDGDLAAAELEKWEAAPQGGATRPAIPRPPVAQPAPVASIVAQPAKVGREQPKEMASAAVPAATHAGPSRPVVAVAPPVAEEDDWEWTIAIARARTSPGEEEETIASAAPDLRVDATPVPAVAKPALASRPAPAASAAAVPSQLPSSAPIAAAMPTPIAASRSAPVGAPVASITRPEREPRGIVAPCDQTRPTHQLLRAPQNRAAPTAVAAPSPTATPATVIPVPALPTLGSARVTHVAPVVRTALPSANLPATPRRLAKGTHPHPAQSASRSIQLDDTVPLQAVPANVHVLPRVATPGPKAAALPSIKRAMRG